ncbi:sushi repeat-containing protein SRPX, partial [Cebus imitator]|uniref:sushi repeat-containing protein SRPX n=1 Tax=Cebus imitator TaxID=2715852 RepID=UPI00189AC8E6
MSPALSGQKKRWHKRRRWVGQSPEPRSFPGGRRKEGRPQAGRREGKRRKEEFSSPAFARPLTRSPWSLRSPPAPWKRTALPWRAAHPLAMGSPAHQPALLLLPPLLLLLLRVPPSRSFPGSGDSPLEDDEVGYSHPRYKDTPWCSPIKVKYGDVYCRAPQGGYYKTALGSRCDIRCQKGYELHGSSLLICQSNKRWSDKVICK